MTPPESAPVTLRDDEIRDHIEYGRRDERARIVGVLAAEAARVDEDGNVDCRWCGADMATDAHTRVCPVTIAETVNHGE